MFSWQDPRRGGVMEKPFCSITKERLLMIVHNLETMYDIFWSHFEIYNAEQIQAFLEAKNRIAVVLENSIQDKERGERR